MPEPYIAIAPLLLDPIASLLGLIVSCWILYSLVKWILFSKTPTVPIDFETAFRLVFKCIGWLFRSIRKVFGWLFQKAGKLLSFKSSTIYGSANWLLGKEKRKLLSKSNDGLFINGIERISEQSSFNHLLIVGPSGKGKSSTFFMVNAGNMSGQSFVCTDPKGEIADLVIPQLTSLGYTIRWFNLSDPRHSHVFNPLDYVTSYSEVRQLANILVEAKYSKATGDQIYWNSGAERLIGVLLWLVKHLEPEHQHLGRVAQFLAMLRTDEQEKVEQLIIRHLDDDRFRIYKSWTGEPEKSRDGMLSTARIVLDAFFDDNLLAVTSGRDSLNIHSMRSHSIALFLTIPTFRLDYYGFILTLLYKFLFDFCCGHQPRKEDKPIYFLLDEFANIPKVPGFQNIISYARSFHVSLSLGVQSLKQLSSLYGTADAETVLENCASKIYLPGIQNYETTQQISLTLGNRTLHHRETGFQLDTARETEKQRPLMTPDEVRRMADDQMLFLYSNHKPLLLKATRYYENKAFLKRMRTARKER